MTPQAVLKLGLVDMYVCVCVEKCLYRVEYTSSRLISLFLFTSNLICFARLTGPDSPGGNRLMNMHQHKSDARDLGQLLLYINQGWEFAHQFS